MGADPAQPRRSPCPHRQLSSAAKGEQGFRGSAPADFTATGGSSEERNVSVGNQIQQNQRSLERFAARSWEAAAHGKAAERAGREKGEILPASCAGPALRVHGIPKAEEPVQSSGTHSVTPNCGQGRVPPAQPAPMATGTRGILIPASPSQRAPAPRSYA